MGQLTTSGDIAIAQLAFFAPALCIAAFVFYRHGFSRSAGWFYLVILSILRLISGSCVLYIETKNDYSVGLLETAAITDSIGTAPLLLALLGILERVNANLREKARDIPQAPYRLVHLLTLVALIIAIVGSVNLPRTPDAYAQGDTWTKLFEAATVLWLFFWLILSALAVITCHRISSVAPTERKLVYAALITIPFLLVRVLFTVLIAFDASPKFFYLNVDVYLRAFMQFLMEAIVVAVFLIVGVLATRIPKQSFASSSGRQGQYNYGAQDIEMTANRQANPGHQRQNPQRSLGDYRPSRLIRNAISNRNR